MNRAGLAIFVDDNTRHHCRNALCDLIGSTGHSINAKVRTTVSGTSQLFTVRSFSSINRLDNLFDQCLLIG
jgi:hypothetical protein